MRLGSISTLRLSVKQDRSTYAANTESAFTLIKNGKEKQAEEMFPWEYYLIQKYLDHDLNDFSALIENRLTLGIK